VKPWDCFRARLSLFLLGKIPQAMATEVCGGKTTFMCKSTAATKPTLEQWPHIWDRQWPRQTYTFIVEGCGCGNGCLVPLTLLSTYCLPLGWMRSVTEIRGASYSYFPSQLGNPVLRGRRPFFESYLPFDGDMARSKHMVRLQPAPVVRDTGTGTLHPHL
jgi:hypothetical protein